MDNTYSLVSEESENVSKYVENILENSEEDVSLKVSYGEIGGVEGFGVSSGYDTDTKRNLEYLTDEPRNIGNYLSTRLREGMNDLEVSLEEEKYKVSNLGLERV